jgi:hypothetical protein
MKCPRCQHDAEVRRPFNPDACVSIPWLTLHLKSDPEFQSVASSVPSSI